MEVFKIEEFRENPSIGYLRSHKVRKDDWIDIAEKYEFISEIRHSWRKSQIKHLVLNKLVELEILSEEAFDLCDEQSSEVEVKRLEI